MPSNRPPYEEALRAFHPEAFASEADVAKRAKQVVQWFRDAHPKLTNLTIEDVYDLSYGFNLLKPFKSYIVRNVHVLSCNSYFNAASPTTNPRFLAALQAKQDVRAAAVQLRRAIRRHQKHLNALSGGVDQALAAVVAALDKAALVEQSRRLKGGRPKNVWFALVRLHAEEIEQVLRANGFPRASMASDSGPAPAVMANIIRAQLGLEITPATIAREWRAANKVKRGQNADPGGTLVQFPPRAKQN